MGLGFNLKPCMGAVGGGELPNTNFLLEILEQKNIVIPMLLVTRPKCVSEDSKKTKRKILSKKISRQKIFSKLFFVYLKSSEIYADPSLN